MTFSSVPRIISLKSIRVSVGCGRTEICWREVPSDEASVRKLHKTVYAEHVGFQIYYGSLRPYNIVVVGGGAGAACMVVVVLYLIVTSF